LIQHLDIIQHLGALVELVRDVIATTRSREFFDARDLQPGSEWGDALMQNAAKSALLAVRTDLYPSRERVVPAGSSGRETERHARRYS
jgi:hypothetical protein